MRINVPATATLAFLAACRSERSGPDADPIVFVCEHGAAKSVIAAAELNRAARERGLATRAIARGAFPQPDPSSRAVAGLVADGLTASPARPQPLTWSDVHRAPRVIVFDCDEPAMMPLRGLDACWNDAPPVSEGYAGTRDAIRAHVNALLTQLTIAE